LASVSADDVRDVINVTSEDVPDDKISKMIKRAEVTLELETDKQVDSSNCKWDRVSPPTRIEDLVSVKAPFVAKAVAIS
jgi:hypothetical protein